jgi:hypothetical protein
VSLRALGHGQHRGCFRATGHDRLASGEQDAELDRHERASWVPPIARTPIARRVISIAADDYAPNARPIKSRRLDSNH